MSSEMEPHNSQRSHDTLRQLLIERLLHKLESVVNQQPLNLNYLEFVTRHELIVFNSFSDQTGDVSEIVSALQSLLYLVQQEMNESTFHIELEQSSCSGQSKIVIEREKLKDLLDTHLPVGFIAKCLGVSRRTVYRRMQEYGFSVRGSYSIMTDQELDGIISSLKSHMPNAGYRMVHGHLISMGLRVQWWRMKASMHRVDAAGIFSRLTEVGCVVKRCYSVRGPLSLVHIDTNHKLIRYNIVIFGGVDGYSRKVLYLNATTNNKAETAFSFFLRASELHGVPSRVRADQGVENLDIAHFMFATQGTGRGSFISGKSVHNQRVERLWRDVWTAVTSKHYDVLHALEEDGLLDISDATLLFGVHYIFLPRLQADLDMFAKGWNNHPLRTEGGLTPEQLWHIGHMQDLDESKRLQDLQEPGVNWEGVVLQEDPDSGVVVPEVECPLNEETLEVLTRSINPLEHSNSNGYDLYLRFLQHVSNH
ncbi:hypothetical protein OJAV_G00136230 [Oryzias javanicus]|uniref:Integrase catalytic domain-containing protein n=1 Tax=Oryzias javanicus TaxID=123683 RepID=A0A437CLX4_ORYJA|nr:hypothetical protein OJAV_G00136230 [Oryzias javanicus]